MIKLSSTLSLCASLLLFAGLPLRAGNIVLNPSFENGPNCLGFTGGRCAGQAPWVFTSGPDPAFAVGSGRPAPGGGAKSAYFGGGSYDTISQVLTTEPGQLYNLTFWLFTGLNHSNADFRVLWDSVMVYDDPAGTDLAHQFPYTKIFVYSLAGTGSDTLAFQGYNPPAQDYFDLVDVEAAPEPASWMLVCVGALLLACRRHRS
jgi:hypothetical protein